MYLTSCIIQVGTIRTLLNSKHEYLQDLCICYQFLDNLSNSYFVTRELTQILTNATNQIPGSGAKVIG